MAIDLRYIVRLCQNDSWERHYLHLAMQKILKKEYDISAFLLDKWIVQSLKKTGSFKEKDNRSPEEQELIELRKRNKQLEIEAK